jgi:hypothetical protein
MRRLEEITEKNSWLLVLYGIALGVGLVTVIVMAAEMFL